MSDTIPTTAVLQLQDSLVGTRLGEYDVLEPIGEGGMGVVYRAIHPLIKKRVAIKVLKPGTATDEAHVKRLIAEAEAVNAVGHRHIVDIFGLGRLDDGRPYIVMEFLEGQPLDAWLRATPRPPLPQVLTLLIEIAAPLAAAHGKGVIHRDLKPSNVFLCREADGAQYIKLLDFGLAKRAMADGNSAQSSQHIVAGTPDYMAPEQARAMPVSARTDIYAFGAMAYEMLTGEPPFDGHTPMDVMMAHVSRPVPSPRALVPGLPVELDALVQRCLQKAPEDRPASIADVRAELKVVLSKLSPTGSYLKLPEVLDRSSSSNETPTARAPATEQARALAPTAAPDEPLQLQAPPRSRLAVPLVLGAVSLLAAGGYWLTRPPATELPEVVTPPPVEPTPLARIEVAPPPAPPTPPTPTLPPAVEPPEESRPQPTPKPTAPRPRREPLQPEQLLARIEALSREFTSRTPAGESPDPGAMKMLAGYRLKAHGDEDERLKVERNLAAFERSFVAPLRKR